ncbi:TPA: DUF551 domain-containing protein [Escherichia coli]|nr:DUF551 domain-containing protein [Escherichia coli]
MSTITKERLREHAREKVKSLEFAVTQTAFANSRAELEEELELARIALASLEADPVGEVIEQQSGMMLDGLVISEKPTYRNIKGIHNMKMMPLGTQFYTAPPAPVSVPDAMEMDDDFDSAFEHGKAVGWNACRAAMLQGSDGTLTNEGTITATQFKPVADLYGLTSPTGGETSFTFDAVEARDFIDGGWSCQEYVELERFQEAVSGNSPVIPDGWVACSERMPETMVSVLVTGTWFHHAVAFWDGLSWCDLDFEPPVTHWMPLPAAPQQEVK